MLGKKKKVKESDGIIFHSLSTLAVCRLHCEKASTNIFSSIELINL